MLGITTFHQHTHQYHRFSQSPILIGSDPKAGSNSVSLNDHLVSPHHCQLSWTREQGHLVVELQVVHGSVSLNSGARIHAGRKVRFQQLESFWLGDTAVELHDLNARFQNDSRIVERTLTGGKALATELGKSPSPETLVAWFEALGTVQKCSANSDQFFEVAARACFCPGGMDGAIIVKPTDEGWKTLGAHIRYPATGIGFREQIVQKAIESKSLLYHPQPSNKREALEQSVVACPILDDNQECMAVLYAFRSPNRRNNRVGIRPLEASFIQLIAGNVATAMQRVEQDSKAARSRVLLEQAFSPAVARTLEQNREILEGRERTITSMFCDLREFTSISERIGPKKTYEFLSDMMDYFTQLVVKHQGVIVDYYGDGLSAFWNAPLDTPEHTALACQCAQEIAALVPVLERKWAALLGHSLNVGIGIHTGKALVGNAGSNTRLKYGPQGPTVNLAARLESATKFVGARILISEQAANELPEHFLTRRVCRAQLAGSRVSIGLVELLEYKANEQRISHLTEYETALASFEKGDFQQAILELTELVVKNESDLVAQFLLEAACRNAELAPGQRPMQSTKQDIYPLWKQPTRTQSNKTARSASGSQSASAAASKSPSLRSNAKG